MQCLYIGCERSFAKIFQRWYVFLEIPLDLAGYDKIKLLGIIHLVLTQNFPKKPIISCPLIRTRTCVYQKVRNVSFPENFAYVLHE